MVKSYTKTTGIVAATLISIFSFNPAFAASEYNTDFNVNVKEVLSVSITTPTEWASGDINTFLRNKVNVTVNSNNTAGFTASMTTKTTDTFLTNTSKNTFTLPTLGSNTTRSSFPTNYWGYSLDDTDAGSDSSTYSALVGAGSTPITLLSSTSATSGSRDFYFGAKADLTKAAGTYTGTVVVNVVSGVIDPSTNPVTPTNPATPTNTGGSGNPSPAYNPAPTGGSSNGTTAYTYTTNGSGSSSNTSTTTTEVSDGDNRGAYEGYTPPQGETYSSNTNINSSSALATGLAVTSALAAASGTMFFILAKRRKDEEEEEQQQLQQ